MIPDRHGSLWGLTNRLLKNGMIACKQPKTLRNHQPLILKCYRQNLLPQLVHSFWAVCKLMPLASKQVLIVTYLEMSFKQGNDRIKFPIAVPTLLHTEKIVQNQPRIQTLPTCSNPGGSGSKHALHGSFPQ